MDSSFLYSFVMQAFKVDWAEPAICRVPTNSVVVAPNHHLRVKVNFDCSFFQEKRSGFTYMFRTLTAKPSIG